MRLKLPAGWNRSRATALGVALILHVVAAVWLLSLRFQRPADRRADPEFTWLPLPAKPPLAPRARPEEPPLRELMPVVPAPVPKPVPDSATQPALPDWYGTARNVADAIGGGPERRSFGEIPEGPPKRPKEETPPSIWPKPLPRVGTTVTTPEGETILWVSDYCYISLGTRSLTLDHIHKGRAGVRTCVLYQFGGKRKARGDLLDPIKRLPKKLPETAQEPGCGAGDERQSCAP